MDILAAATTARITTDIPVTRPSIAQSGLECTVDRMVGAAMVAASATAVRTVMAVAIAVIRGYSRTLSCCVNIKLNTALLPCRVREAVWANGVSFSQVTT